MSALQHATAAAEVSAFLACNDDVVHKGAQTLSVSSVCHRLNHLEVEWASLASEAHLTVSARAQALQHYYDVYNVCARTVPLPQAVWDRWADGITSSFPVTDASEASSASLETLRAELILQYWGLFCRVHWGCACAARPRLAFATEQAHTALRTSASARASSDLIASNEEAEVTQDTCSVESLQRDLATPLHTFAKLAHDMSHLFGLYAVVGAVERQWLNEEVLAHRGDVAETAVEALVRRSYKRDLQVPSASLPALLQEYEENEVEQRKAKEIVAIGKATLTSSWMRAAVVLQEHLESLPRSADDVTGASTTAKDAHLVYDDKAYELLEQLMQELRKAPHGHGNLPALGLLTHRVVEWRPSSASTRSDTAGLNGSQTQFYLFLLHQWFAHYITLQHRWSVTDTFNAEDDSDMWSFVLDRHSFCLMWALASFESATEHRTSTRKEEQARFMTAMDANIDKLRSVFYSVVHCLQLYRAAVVTFTNPEKCTTRLRAARDAVHAWVHRVGVTALCRGLLGDLLDTAEEWEDSNRQTPPLQQWTLNAEAELKLIMYDTMELLGCPDNTTDRLETLVHVALDLCSAWKEQCTEKTTAEASATIPASLFSSVAALVVRVMQRIRARLRHDLDSASKLSSAHVALHLKLVEWVKQLLSLVAAYAQPETMNAIWDEYVQLVSLPVPSTVSIATTVGDGDDASGLTEVIRGFVSYASSTSKRTFGTPSPANSGLNDISWERRNVFKLRRRREGEAESNPQRTASAVSPREDEKGGETTAATKRMRTE